ncbi:MAG: shikimate kinase [Bacteroidales bacterium]|nr:shikimate kinase [Bacteroidales bacterium]
MKDRIYLIGFMGAGKTTVGKKLADVLGYQFIDLDDYFEEHYKIDIQGFFDKYGEELFRNLEYERLLKTFEMKNVVVATGGGTPCYHDSIDEINKNGVSVYLEMTPAAIADRLINAVKKRPLLEGRTGDELIKYIETKLDERLAYYEKAHLTVDGVGVDLKKLVESLEQK